MRNKILLIDGNSILFRAYYGSAYGPTGVLKTSKGVPVNAVLTFNNMLNKYISKITPTHVVVAFDPGKKTFRNLKMESYKAGRSAAPDDMKPQWSIVKTMLDKMNIKHVAIDNFEADDLIGTWSVKWAEKNEIVILSSDKDLYQLVNDSVQILSPQNGAKDDKVVNNQNFNELTGIYPEQIIDYKGIVGDPSDNLPGIKGIGDKTAVKLLSKYKTLKNIYNHLDELTQGQKNKFEKDKNISFLCKEIATIKLDVETKISLGDIIFRNETTQELIDFYKKYELNSLVKRYQNKVEKKISEFSNFEL